MSTNSNLRRATAWTSILAFVIIAISVIAASAAAPPYHVLFNGQYLPLSQPPIQRGGRVFVPMRAISRSSERAWRTTTARSTRRPVIRPSRS